MPVAVMVICPPSAQAAWVTVRPSCSANTVGVAGVAGGAVSSSAAAGVARVSAATAPSTPPHLMIFTLSPLDPPARCRRESVVCAARPGGWRPAATPFGSDGRGHAPCDRAAGAGAPAPGHHSASVHARLDTKEHHRSCVSTQVGYKADDVIYYGPPEPPYQQLAAILAARIARGE